MNSRFKLLVVTSSTLLVVLLLVGAAIGQSASPDDAYRHFAVYTEVLSRIKSEYVEEPDITNVTLGAMNGMLEALDPFASYLSPEQYKQYMKEAAEKQAGVGLVLSRKFGYIGVVNAIPGSSAARAGLTTGDMLESINDIGTRDMPLAYAEMLLKGEPGTNVELSVMRVRKPEPQKITLTRAPTRYPGITSKLLPDGIGLVNVPSLDSPAKVKDVAGQLEQLQKQGAKKFILDLRNSGFGKPEYGVDFADLFLDKGLITYSEGQKLGREDYKADPQVPFKSQPLVLITNRGTANAAEVAAAALLDSKRAEIVGERTYGDAAIRKPVTMEDGSAVILSVAKFHSPSGKAIQDTGVTPTFMVTETEPFIESEDEAQPQPEPKKQDEDELLKKAVEVLTKGKDQVQTSGTAGATSQTEPQQPVKPLPLTEKERK